MDYKSVKNQLSGNSINKLKATHGSMFCILWRLGHEAGATLLLRVYLTSLEKSLIHHTDSEQFWFIPFFYRYKFTGSL